MQSLFRATITVMAVCFASVIAQSGDTVHVTPPGPTDKDSLHFDLFNFNLDCCTQYYYKNVAVSDTMIMLSFEYLDNNTCECFAAGSHVAFACGPQKAGKYSIYKAQSAYCATPPCPLGPVQLVRVGEVIVGGTAALLPPPSIGNGGIGLAITQEKNILKIEYLMKQQGLLTVNVFDARGMNAGTLCDKQAFTGTNRFSWTAAAPGVYFMSVKVNKAPVASRKLVISR